MDIREKLVKQLSWWATECDRTNFGCQASKLLVAAAKYIANNVKVQEWIPVSERLPEPWTPVLVYRPDMVSKILVAEHGGYCDEDDDGWQRYGKDLYNNPVITHWMPLPTPPKGE